MRSRIILGLFVCWAVVPATASAQVFDFSFTASGFEILDHQPEFSGLVMSSAFADFAIAGTIDEILSIELEITGLSHSRPEDLLIILLPALKSGEGITILDGQGGEQGVSNISLVFNDAAGGPAPFDALLAPPNESATFQPVGLPFDGGFSSFFGLPGGEPLTWILFVSDRTSGGEGSFEEWTLRGTAVPEPVTLSLLALGALVTLRRRRRST